MEPLKPETKRAILQNRPEATPADLEEYERLLGERFRESPAAGKTAAAVRIVTDREKRLKELHKKLFG